MHVFPKSNGKLNPVTTPIVWVDINYKDLFVSICAPYLFFTYFYICNYSLDIHQPFQYRASMIKIASFRQPDANGER